MSSKRSAIAFHGCAMSLRMAVQFILSKVEGPATNSGTRSRAMEAGLWRSSSAPTPPRHVLSFAEGASSSYPVDGWSSAPLHGWADAAVSPRTGRNPSKAPPHGQPSPASACSRAESQGSQLIEKLLNQALRSIVLAAAYKVSGENSGKRARAAQNGDMPSLRQCIMNESCPRYFHR